MLLIGYGNQGRGDDGLGPALAFRLENRRLPGLAIDIDYQLTVDHALAVSKAGCVVFADASVACANPFTFATAKAAEAADIASHSLSPEAILALSQTLYGRAPHAFVLGIAGTVFGDIREGLSATARYNLDCAEAFFVSWYRDFAGREAGHLASE
ncbi:hydrogenase maturation protease [Martelella lutilitoris]|uniref:Hydrogenase maturation protease n=1 Tax=Martelella lutilitoris TaxID=2583532 RepID=A0A5C4JLS5_9HYPH|nr:hydrogenase maturation protease [Martelella lutilitoris]TNB46257.1 hydrogenase maturation protease [Martelella lutilitoris]